MLNNNFSYTQFSLAFVPRKGSYYVHDDTGASFRFVLQKDFYITHEHIDAFCLSLLPKDFGAFHVILFEAFLCFFDNSYLSFFYIEKKKN